MFTLTLTLDQVAFLKSHCVFQLKSWIKIWLPVQFTERRGIDAVFKVTNHRPLAECMLLACFGGQHLELMTNVKSKITVVYYS